LTPVPKTQKRIGLFGGSFDPVHVGHRSLAVQAADQLQLDELRWIPAGQPWQKTGRPLASAQDRAAMVALSLQGDPRFRLDPSELRRHGPSYTIDTVMALREHAPRAQLFLILGQDQYARFHTWNSWRELLSQVTLAVTSRDGHAPRPGSELAQTWHRLVVLHMAPSAASSTAVREHLAHGARAIDLVPHLLSKTVALYIDQHGLYRSPQPATHSPHTGLTHGHS
jgi:nicotinate-nucleotide adenylyltransferase